MNNPQPTCPLCGASRTAACDDLQSIIRSVYRGSVPVVCQGCGLGFMWPIPTPDDVGGVYEAEYFRAYSDSGIAMPAAAATPPARYLTRLASVEQRSGIGRLLEVGPGTGAFLRYAKHAGWDVQGIETSAYAAKEMATTLGLDVRCGTLLTTRVADARFDVIHMSHVLEHMADPLANLTAAHRALRPGGSLILEVPNEFSCLQFRLLRAARLLRPYSVGSSHIFFFTPSTLRRLLERAGFRVLRLASVRDCDGGSLGRTVVRRMAAAAEGPLGLAPLIEAIAIT